jgi:predicted Zn-dependent protease
MVLEHHLHSLESRRAVRGLAEVVEDLKRARPFAVLLLLLGCMSAHARPTATSAPVPGLPEVVKSVYGPVPVSLVENLNIDGISAFGAYFPDSRKIFLRADMQPLFAQGVLAHETCHLALGDAGIDLPEQIAEHVCDAMAMQHVQEFR